MKRKYTILTLIILLLTIPLTSINSDALTAKHTINEEVIEIKLLEKDHEKIKWELTFNRSGADHEGIQTEIDFGSGLKHGTISESTESEVTKKSTGYSIYTPEGNGTDRLELVTPISNEEEIYEIQAVAITSEGEIAAKSQAELTKDRNEDKLEEEQSLQKATGDEEDSMEPEEDEKKEREIQTESEEKKHNSSQTENEAVTSKAQSNLPKQLSALNNNFNPKWPDPGSLLLDKVATPTENYAEWEIELTVEGKDLSSTSDIVLVLDKSSSMDKNNRFENMLKAAENLAETVMTDNPNTRIALVEFDRDPNTRLDFTNDKNTVIKSLENMEMGSGTNIHGGIYYGRQLLDQSDADQKTIVLLSDGSPNRTYIASHATEHSNWPKTKKYDYDYRLYDFDYTKVVRNFKSYKVDGYKVDKDDRVIGTISEAYLATLSGYTMYSIGLEVKDSETATYTIENSQNAGYYPADSEDLDDVFDEIAQELLKHAAKFSVTTDPMGEMFNLVKDKNYSGEDFHASHGTVEWNEDSETFTWHMGDIKEDQIYSLKYKVTIDWEKNPIGEVLYPTNGETLLNYKDPYGNDKTKYYPIPEASIEKGKVIKQGYRVNIDGQPVDENGNLVSSPAEAEQFYEVIHTEDGQEELKFHEKYSVPSNEVPDYTLHVGDDSTDVELNPDNPIETVWFGYVKTEDLIAGDITAKYVDQDGNEIADQEVLTGKVGERYTTKQKDIPGYEFVKVDENGAPASGKFKKDSQTVTYMYKKILGSLTVTKVDEDGNPLADATFEVRDKNDEIVGVAQTTDGDGKIVFENLEWDEYTLKETKAPEGYRLLTKPFEVTIDVDNLDVELEVENTKTGWGLPTTGGMGTIVFYALGALLMLGALVFLMRIKNTNN